jgi:hypothetical protein
MEPAIGDEGSGVAERNSPVNVPSADAEASVVTSSVRLVNVRLWHLADNRGTATFCPLLDKSGYREPLVTSHLTVHALG